MDDFSRCVAFTLAEEGGFSKNPGDPGNWTGGAVGQGALQGTNFGISAAAYPDLDMANLTQADAMAIYQRDYWMAIQGDALPFALALAGFDAAVNAGPRRAVAWLQLAADVAPDGVMGPLTLAALNTGDALKLAREALARRLVYSTQLATWPNFSLGWTRRMINLAGMLTA